MAQLISRKKFEVNKDPGRKLGGKQESDSLVGKRKLVSLITCHLGNVTVKNTCYISGL